jgi:hypothetical protein
MDNAAFDARKGEVAAVCRFRNLSLSGARIMKWKAKIVLVLLSTVARIACAQSSTDDRGLAQKTQVPVYWVDPSTGLMWTGKDNGKDVNWKNAVKYCRDLRLAGYSDWRLATIGELEGIYDKDANAPGLMGPSGKGTASTWHVKGNLFLTGNQWSSTRFGGYAPRFDFNEGRVFNGDEVWFYTNKRALCVRRPRE